MRNDDEVAASAKRMLKIGKASGGEYLGDRSPGRAGLAADRYATAARAHQDGQVALMSWHCETRRSSTQRSCRARSGTVAAGLRERFDMFDDWGMFAYTNGAFKSWGDYLTEIDIGIWEMKWDDESWAAWVDAKREIARIAIEHGGSISACHGSCREGEVDLVPDELGGGFEVMKQIKRTLDPNNIMNPGKYLLDEAYEEVES
jgi:glycolate oxidase